MATTLRAIADLRERVSVREFERRLSRLSRKHRAMVREAMGTPPDPANVPQSLWDEIERQHKAALFILFFGAAIPTLEVAFSRFTRSGHELDDPDELRDALESLSRRRADWVGESVAQTTRERLERGAAAGRSTEDVLSEIFGEDRWNRTARNESVAAQSAGGSAVADVARRAGIDVTEIWYLGACEHCDTCPMLHGTSRSFWGLWTDGPPLHPNCCCHLQVFFEPEDELIRRRLLVNRNPSFGIVDSRMQKFRRRPVARSKSAVLTRSLGEFFGFTKEAEPKDGDGDGMIYDGTPEERPVEKDEQNKDFAVIANRFRIPEQAVRDIAEQTADELKRRDIYFPGNNSTEPTTDFERFKIGSVKIDSFHSDPTNAYVNILTEFDPMDLKTSEAEDGIKQRDKSYPLYVEWARRGIEPPPISTGETWEGNGTIVSSNRRRVLAAQEAGSRSIKAWHSPINKETGLPLKYGDVKSALSNIKN